MVLKCMKFTRKTVFVQDPYDIEMIRLYTTHTISIYNLAYPVVSSSFVTFTQCS